MLSNYLIAWRFPQSMQRGHPLVPALDFMTAHSTGEASSATGTP
ncbi:hypothetical protein J2797_000117 [Paraburkholderia terricola]|jgi:hypothetical protein|uniref:Uncharacterized protein n=1 Tax=Paraburkholderia terricola TaxID=169427 RepID=A0A1M6PS19_9BURK|nr:hypothetical protein [Paraburkholderia terricola]SDO48847.1 hypothetical protein SAMN05192547_1017109 [Paraburkholderia sediminicola]SHK10743.1 hypothetical protein SAMN05192548_1013137 [Paraburkholderia terricola]